MKKRGFDISYAYSNGKSGARGGMFTIINYIYNELRSDSIKKHIHSVIDRYVTPTSFEEQVALIKEIFQKFGLSLKLIDTEHPELYAKNYEIMIQKLINIINNQSSKYIRQLYVRDWFGKNLWHPYLKNF